MVVSPICSEKVMKMSLVFKNSFIQASRNGHFKIIPLAKLNIRIEVESLSNLLREDVFSPLMSVMRKICEMKIVENLSKPIKASKMEEDL